MKHFSILLTSTNVSTVHSSSRLIKDCKAVRTCSDSDMFIITAQKDSISDDEHRHNINDNPENKLARPHPKSLSILWHHSEKPNWTKKMLSSLFYRFRIQKVWWPSSTYNDKSHYTEKNHTIRSRALGRSINHHADGEQARDFWDSTWHNADSISCIVSSLDEGENFALGTDWIASSSSGSTEKWVPSAFIVLLMKSDLDM